MAKAKSKKKSRSKFAYLFFLVHLLMFGISGFNMSYGNEPAELHTIFLHGGMAILAYCIFYLAIFGLEEVKWMFINALLGLYGIYTEIDWILSAWGKSMGDYAFAYHIIPFSYYVLYTFLIRQVLLDVFKARDNKKRLKKVNNAYVIGSLVIYTLLYLILN